jgi:hypothetical protein
MLGDDQLDRAIERFERGVPEQCLGAFVPQVDDASVSITARATTPNRPCASKSQTIFGANRPQMDHHETAAWFVAGGAPGPLWLCNGGCVSASG